jgi:hypothetical protein
MSTPAQIRAAWAAKVWAHSSIKALTTKIYNFDLESVAELSTAHKSLMYYNQRINFFQYRVTKARQFGLSGGKVMYKYPVVIRYYREATIDLDGSVFNAVEDAFETLFTAVQSQLGTSWNNTVDYYEIQVEPASVDATLLDDKLVWVGQYSFQGIKEATL